MKEFRILQNCSICGEGFDSDYKLLKHMSKFHPQPKKTGWVGGDDSCSCGGHHTHKDG
ncbi:MAG: hypothetical protein QXX64_01500 [Nitrososphaera sp.]|uniref:hypothetical protein n=1 Tax=Candidatus Nitrososphaera gargensis TaxID=497727 RepID=UPI00164F9F9D|nr:hypothetical protein [Candidatus Nitrososphaera gargensis]